MSRRMGTGQTASRRVGNFDMPSRSGRSFQVQEASSRFQESHGMDSGFMSMSRFASMSFDEARGTMHQPPLSNSSVFVASRGGHIEDSPPLENMVRTISTIFGGFPAHLPASRPLSRGIHFRPSSHREPGAMDEYQMLQLLDEGVVKRGVSDRRMRAIPIKPVDRRMVGKDKCHVCQCEYTNADRVMELPCKHCYHPDCIKGWFKENRTCPVCRFEVEA